MPNPKITRNVMPAVIAAVLGFSAHLSAQAPDVDDIRGPKPLIEIPHPEKADLTLWLALGGAALLLLIAWLMWKKLARKRHLKSPPEIALASLAELEAARHSLTAEAFANRATQTIRQYLSDRFGLAAPRRTTEEFLRDLTAQQPPSLSGQGDHLRAFLKSCDLAKFAGSNLDETQRLDLLQTARAFIQATSAATPESTPKVAAP